MSLDERGELARLEGVWIGTERVHDTGAPPYEANARLVFQTLFNSKFLLCDYSQTAHDRPTSVGHAVFRRDDQTHKLVVTWFRNPIATATQLVEGVAEDDRLVFVEAVAGRVTRTTYTSVFDRLSIRTEREVSNDEWKILLEGTYRRR